MPKYVIERELPGAGALSTAKLQAISQKSNEVLAGMAPRAQWQHSYVAGDRTFCIYLAENEDKIHEHAAKSGFPASKVTEVTSIIDPTTEAYCNV